MSPLDEIRRLELLNRHNRWQAERLRQKPALSQAEVLRLAGLDATWIERKHLIDRLAQAAAAATPTRETKGIR